MKRVLSFDQGDEEPNLSNKKPRFSATDGLVHSILATKRALRDKVAQKEDATQKPEERSVRQFGRDFSPTIYSPDKACNVKSCTAEDVEKFQLTIMSIDSQCINANYEDQVQNYIHDNYGQAVATSGSLCYESLEQYKQIYTPLIIYDTWAQICDSYQSNSRPAAIQTVRCYSTVEQTKFVYINLKGSLSSNDILQGRHLLDNWIVAVQEQDKRSPILVGFVEDSSAVESDQGSKKQSRTLFRFVVKFPKFLEDRFTNDCYTIEPLFYLKPTLRLIETIAVMSTRTPFFDKILQPDYGCCEFEPLEATGVRFKFVDSRQYNEFQQAAITGCYSAIMRPFSTVKVMLVQGPPGTGKTHTLVGIVKNMFANFESDKGPLRIMICAPSNGAIDEIGRRLLSNKHFLKPFKSRSLRIVRIGQKAQIHSDIHRYLLDNLIDMNLEKAQKEKKYGNSKLRNPDLLKRSRVRDDLLLNADVILSTLSSCQQSSLELFRDKFSSKSAIRCLIVDEASQCSEPELLMPFVFRSITKVILIGDHLQLPATVISKKAQQLNYGRSLFERFIGYFEKQVNTGLISHLPLITLNRQFRMHPMICSFPSKQFYKGLLQTASKSGHNPSIRIQPYFVFDLANSVENCSSRGQTGTKYNLVEVDFVCQLLKRILKKLGHPVDTDQEIAALPEKLSASIGVVTFYRGQKSVIVSCLKQFHSGILLKHVEVNTVDAFQGQERDIVILSCVRAFDPAQGCGSIGFLRSQQRMNVALTRAKSSLFICISGKSFVDVPRWQQLLTDAQSRQRYIRIPAKASDQMLEAKISI